MAAFFLIGSQVKNKKLLMAPRMTGAENAKIRQESPTPKGTENAKGREGQEVPRTQEHRLKGSHERHYLVFLRL